MKILITGAKGFVGRNLAASLECVRDGKDQRHKITGLERAGDLEIVSYDIGNTLQELEDACRDASFVFHIAGVNRPKEQTEFMTGNYGFTETLLNTLEKYGNTCPVLLSSSIQATLLGRYAESDYGRSKLAGEELLFRYGLEHGAKVLVYRFPNLFGKWCRPNYNSAVATFCHNIANDLPVRVDDRNTQLELVYIDDLIEEMFRALNGKEHRCNFDGPVAVPHEDGRYCYVPEIHRAALGEIVDLLEQFHAQPHNLLMPELPAGSFIKKLYSAYLSYLPEEKNVMQLVQNSDERGSFVEFFKTVNSGQFSININKPGTVKGQHWHHSKWEIFIVVSGHGLIQERRIGLDENGELFPVREFRVSGDKPEAVYLLPGYTHNLVNLSDTEDLVTLIWANEQFDPERPDTFRETVGIPGVQPPGAGRADGDGLE